MKKNLIIALSTFIILFVMIPLTFFNMNGEANELPGKKVFVDKKCMICHSVPKFDLVSSSVGKRNFSELNELQSYDSVFIKRYLTKEDKLNNKKHPISFNGTDQEFDDLIEFLLEIK